MRVVIAGTTQSPKVSSARSSGNSCASAHSRRTARRDESSANTSTSFSTQSGGIQPTDTSAQSSSNFAGNHVSSRYSQCVHKTQASSDLAAGLYDHLTGRGAEISYEFKDMSVKIPSGTGDKAEHAEWVVSGTMTIRTKDNSTRPK